MDQNLEVLKPEPRPKTPDESKGIVPIDQVPKDYDPEKIVLFTNPTKQDFPCGYDGREYVIPANSSRAVIEPLAYHFAFHLAQKLLMKPLLKNEADKRDKEANKQDPKVVTAKALSMKVVAEKAKTFVSEMNDEPLAEVG